jgi:ABC-type multidrug transport system fused ATPase/permease subunit
MKLLRTVQASLRLLTRRDRRLLGLATAIQMSMSLLDLLGVLLLGIVTALAVSTVSDVPPPTLITSTLARFGLEDVDTLTLSVWLAVIAGFVLVFKSVINMYLTRRVLNFLANRQALVSGRLAAGLLSRPLLQLQQRSSQETVYALTTSVYFATLIILGQGVVAISEMTLLVVLAAGLLLVSPLVTLFTVLYFFGLGVLLQRIVSRWAVRIGEGAANAEVRSVASVQEALKTYREVTVTNRRSVYVERFQALRWQAARVQADLQFLSLIPKYVFEAALVIGAGLLAASQFLTKDVTAAVAVIAVFLGAGSRVVPSMLRLHGSGLAVLSSAGQAEPSCLLAEELGLNDPAKSTEFETQPVDVEALHRTMSSGYPGFTPSVVAERISMTYPGATEPALQSVSLTVNPGGSLGLVGSTGSGKSTLADVLLGVVSANDGTILIGGLPPLEAVATWPGAIAYVPQDVAIANATVRENVALGLPPEAVQDGWVWEALERAHLAQFLRDHREGLDTVVGEHGVRFSGGQRQRLGMARALYSRPKLLVMDEATSALDAETESAVSATLASLEGHVTTITIAHRLATIRGCDVVAYLEGGRVAAIGTFDEVRTQSSSFDQQARLQGLASEEQGTPNKPG